MFPDSERASWNLDPELPAYRGFDGGHKEQAGTDCPSGSGPQWQRRPPLAAPPIQDLAQFGAIFIWAGEAQPHEGLSPEWRETAPSQRSVTTVAPQPPASAGASA